MCSANIETKNIQIYQFFLGRYVYGTKEETYLNLLKRYREKKKCNEIKNDPDSIIVERNFPVYVLQTKEDYSQKLKFTQLKNVRDFLWNNYLVQNNQIYFYYSQKIYIIKYRQLRTHFGYLQVNQAAMNIM